MEDTLYISCLLSSNTWAEQKTSDKKYAAGTTSGDTILLIHGAAVTRVEVLDLQGDLVGVFLTRRPADEVRGLPPQEFVGCEGEWWPAGGCDWAADEWPLRATACEVVDLDSE